MSMSIAVLITSSTLSAISILVSIYSIKQSQTALQYIKETSTSIHDFPNGNARKQDDSQYINDSLKDMFANPRRAERGDDLEAVHVDNDDEREYWQEVADKRGR